MLYQQLKPRLRGALAGAMYFLLVMECMSMAICLAYGIQYAHMAKQSELMRTKIFSALLVYLWIGFVGYAITVPCVCASIHKNNAKFLIPYLIWRLIFTLGTIGLGVALGLFNQELNQDRAVRKETMEVFVPPIVIQAVFGLLFTILAFIAFARLNSSRKHRKHRDMPRGTVVPYQEQGMHQQQMGMVHPSLAMPSYYVHDPTQHHQQQTTYGTAATPSQHLRGRTLEKKTLPPEHRRSKSLQNHVNGYTYDYSNWNPYGYYGYYGNWKY